MTLEKIIIDKYGKYGRLSADEELLLPLGTWEGFRDDCNQHLIAIIGVDFFIPLTKEKMLAQLNSIDVSTLLKTYQRWETVVMYCNSEVDIMLKKERSRDHRQYYCPTFYEQSKWEQK